MCTDSTQSADIEAAPISSQVDSLGEVVEESPVEAAEAEECGAAVVEPPCEAELAPTLRASQVGEPYSDYGVHIKSQRLTVNR